MTVATFDRRLAAVTSLLRERWRLADATPSAQARRLTSDLSVEDVRARAQGGIEVQFGGAIETLQWSDVALVASRGTGGADWQPIAIRSANV